MLKGGVVLACMLMLAQSASPSSSSSSGSSSPSSPSSASQSSSSISSSVSSSSSGSSGGSQQASLKRDDHTASASGNQPVYSPVAGTQFTTGFGSSGSDYQAAASGQSYQSMAAPSSGGSANSNLYYYYYPNSKGVGGSGSQGDYQASAASNYASIAAAAQGQGGGYDGHSSGGSAYDQSEGGSSYDSSAVSPDGSAYGGAAAAYQQQLQQAYSAAVAAQQGTHLYPGSAQGQYSNIGLTAAASQGAPQYTAQQFQYGGSGGVGSSGIGSSGQYQGSGSYPGASAFQGTYDTSKRYYGLGSMIMPLIALGGLALLLPSVTSLSGKKKRSVNDDPRSNIGEYADRLERYFKIYRAAMDSEECMNRVICELGDSVSNVRGKTAILTIFEKIAPAWMTNKMGVFKLAALTDNQSKCARYKC